MWIFTEVADWWEKQRLNASAQLDSWVESSDYSQGVMLVAASTESVMTFGAGFVDLLRLGDGVVTGTLKGVGQDALRVVAIFPWGKGAQTMKSVQGVTRAKVVVDTGGPNCFWIASAKAFSQIGHKYNGKLLASVDDVAKALGMDMSALWKIPDLATGIAYLRRIGAKVGPVKNVANAKQIVDMVPHDGSVVLIAVHLMKSGRVIGGHAIYAFRNTLGKIQYMDRTITSQSSALYQSLDEIAAMYRQCDKFVPIQAAILQNIFVKSVLGEAPRLFIPILGVLATQEK